MRPHSDKMAAIVVVNYNYRLASLAGSRFNALGTQEWRERKKARHITYPASHSRVTHHGARVAPQRCPILHMSIITVAGLNGYLKKRLTDD